MAFLNLSFDSGFELFLGDLTVVVGVNGIEDLVRFFVGDTFLSFNFCSDLDGRGGGDEGDKGEFHFDLV